MMLLLVHSMGIRFTHVIKSLKILGLLELYLLLLNLIVRHYNVLKSVVLR